MMLRHKSNYDYERRRSKKLRKIMAWLTPRKSTVIEIPPKDCHTFYF